MVKEPTIIGLDIGSHTIKILGAEFDPHTNLYRVKFFEKIPSIGVSKGRVRDEKVLTKRVSDLINKVEEKYNVKIDSLLVNISGSKLNLLNNKATISVSGANGKVSDADKERVLNDIKAINIGSNKQILKTFHKDWILDGERDISDPLGLQGIRLELDASILTCFNSDFEAIENVLLNNNVNECDIIPGPLCVATALLNETQKDLGVVVIDIGAGTTSMIAYGEGKILDLIVFPVGSTNITNDLAIGLQTEIEVAEEIKKEYGICKTGQSKKIEIYLPELLDPYFQEEEDDKKREKKDILTLQEKELRQIVEPRVSEIFELIQKRLKELGRDFPAGIVLTGGGSNLKGLEEFAKSYFKLPCKISSCNGFVGLEKKDSSLTVVSGLVVEGELGEEIDFNKGFSMSSKIKKILKIFNP